MAAGGPRVRGAGQGRALRRSTTALAALLLFWGCARAPRPAPPQAAAPFQFVDVAAEAGLDRVVHAGRPGKDHLLDSIGSGAAWVDFDRDGWLDAYVVNGFKLEGRTVVTRGRNALYKNRRDGTFADVTEAAGVGGEGRWGTGVAVADYDADGWPDILVTCFGPNLLYRNRGDGTFENVAARAGIEAPGWNTGAAFLDADSDGDLDLYVAAYIDCSLDDVLGAERTLDWKGVDKVAFGPFGLRGAPDHFFRSDGRGGFEEATAEAGLVDRAQAFGLGVRAADLDDDGDLDLYVANDSDANYQYRNEGGGTFKEVGLWSGSALDANGAAQAGMGVTVGDATGDGQLDIVVTNFSEDFSTLYRGVGRGFFEDVAAASGVGPLTYLPMSWGVALVDLDNDGDLDLPVANGHIYPQVDQHPEFRMTFRESAQLLENTGSGSFVDASPRAGPGFATPRCARGLAAGDYDNDGDLDLLLTTLDGPPALLRNDSAGANWLTLALEVPPGRGTLIGTRIALRASGKTQLCDVSSGESYLSVHDSRPHFGLGGARAAELVEIRWPDGSRTELRDVEANRVVAVRKGS